MSLFDDEYFNSNLDLPTRKQRTNFFNLAVNYGQFNTIKNWVCEDKHGNPIPWYTYPSIEYLNNLDFSNKSVFEFGSGNSSLYWAKKSKRVVSVEHNKKWFAKVNENRLTNHKLVLCENESLYCEQIKKEQEKFDLIIIDGVERAKCAQSISSNLNHESGFMIILDNSDWYPNTARYIKDTFDLIQIDFHGFTPINAYTSTTSIFLSRNASFKSVNQQPQFSRCAIKMCSIYDKPIE